ncbi:MAG: hypothetical protein IJ787_00730 [Bacilli bacterium]|nr:hypothetical protein [Bacilli bacterium]
MNKKTLRIAGWALGLSLAVAGIGAVVGTSLATHNDYGQIFNAAEATSTLTFTAKCNGSGTADDDVSWTVTSDASESNFDGTKGIHYGTGSAAVSYLRLTTSGIAGTITGITVNASGASGTSAKLNVTVGGSAFGTEKSLTSTATDHTVTGSASGTIVVSLTQSSAKKALYCKSIEVTYVTASSAIEATEVEALIDAIPNPVVNTNACKSAIDAARTKADQYAEQAGKNYADISNYSVLTAAESTYAELHDRAAAAEVDALIEALGEITSYSQKEDVDEAQAAYDDLTPTQQGYVKTANVQALEDAQEVIAELRDRAAAAEVDALIEALGEITSYSQKDSVDAAQDAYDALTLTQQGYVKASNIQALEDAQEAIAALAPLEIEFTFESVDDFELRNAKDELVATGSFQKAKGSNPPAWNAGSSEARLYAMGYLVITVQQNFVMTSFTANFVANENKNGAKPTAKYYAGDAIDDLSNYDDASGWSTSTPSNLSLAMGQQFIIYADGTAGNLGFKSLNIEYEKEVVVTPEVRVSSQSLIVGLNGNSTFTVYYFNINSDFSVASADTNKVQVSYTGAHGDSGEATVTVSGLALTGNTPVNLTVSADGAESKTVAITVREIEQFKLAPSVVKFVDGAEFVFSDGNKVVSEYDTSNKRYTFASAYSAGDVKWADSYIKFTLGVTEDGYTFYDNTNGKYIASTANTKVELKSSLDASCYWSISPATGNTFSIVNGSYYFSWTNNGYLGGYTNEQSKLRVYIKGLDSLTTEQSLIAFAKRFLRYDTAALPETDTGTCKDGRYLTAKAALAGDWSSLRSALEADNSNSIGKRYKDWAKANNDAAPFDGNTTVVTPINPAALNIFFGEQNNENASAQVIALIAAGGVVSLGGLLLLRRRKEN